ncbi:OPRM1 [Mytilus edulis]|uniref:OPRM1 n=1 Tax=Mytilus edulis TaxID=6550 RepID=A0A8S3UFD5_MYTED|nr:OPRM1 [Mytilus edulis]
MFRVHSTIISLILISVKGKLTTRSTPQSNKVRTLYPAMYITTKETPSRSTVSEAITIFGMNITAEETPARSTVREAITIFGTNITAEGTPARTEETPARSTVREAITTFGINITAEETPARSTVREEITTFGMNFTAEEKPARSTVREAITIVGMNTTAEKTQAGFIVREAITIFGIDLTTSSSVIPTGACLNENNTKTRSPNLDNYSNSLLAILKDIEFYQNAYIIPPICLIGLVGNIIVTLVLFDRCNTGSSFVYMFSFVMADILSLLSDMLVSLSNVLELYVSGAWERILIQMRHWNQVFVTYTFRCTAINILCVLSVERFLAIKYPIHLKSSLTARFPFIFISLSFLFGCSANISKVINTKFADILLDGTNLTVYSPVRSYFYLQNIARSNTVILTSKIFSGPLQILIVCIMNGLILYCMYTNRKTMRALNLIAVSQQRKRIQIKLCKIFLVLCLTNILAFLPNSLTIIIGRLYPELGINKITSHTSRFINQAGTSLRIINSASDFLVLVAMSSGIKNAFKNKCICRGTFTPDRKEVSSDI